VAHDELAIPRPLNQSHAPHDLEPANVGGDKPVVGVRLQLTVDSRRVDTTAARGDPSDSLIRGTDRRYVWLKADDCPRFGAAEDSEILRTLKPCIAEFPTAGFDDGQELVADFIDGAEMDEFPDDGSIAIGFEDKAWLPARLH